MWFETDGNLCLFSLGLGEGTCLEILRRSYVLLPLLVGEIPVQALAYLAYRILSSPQPTKFDVLPIGGNHVLAVGTKSDGCDSSIVA